MSAHAHLEQHRGKLALHISSPLGDIIIVHLGEPNDTARAELNEFPFDSLPHSGSIEGSNVDRVEDLLSGLDWGCYEDLGGLLADPWVLFFNGSAWLFAHELVVIHGKNG